MLKGLRIFVPLAIFLTLIYSRSFSNFFFQDDYFNLQIGRANGWWEPFNLFKQAGDDFYFYRPLTTQLFWKAAEKLFGFEPFGYHVINFLVFLVNIVLVYIFFNILERRSSKFAFVATLFYAISGSHFYRLFFLSQFQEQLLTFMTLLTIILFLHGRWMYLITFVLSLMCKETAIMIPIFLLTICLYFRLNINKKLCASFLIAGLYFYLRLKYFGFATGEDYKFIFQIWTTLNNLSWYFLWSLGLPEHYSSLNIFDEKTLINLKLFFGFGEWGMRILISTFFFVLFILIGIVQNIKEYKRITLGVIIFLLFIFPVAFFPFHKFAYSLTLPLIGVSYILGVIFYRFPRKQLMAIVFTFYALNFFSLQYNLSEHWSTGKSHSARKIFKYLKMRFPNGVEKWRNVYFVNNNYLVCNLEKSQIEYSKEAAYGIGGVDGIRLFYNDPKIQTYFVDTDHYKNLYYDSLILDSRLFIR